MPKSKQQKKKDRERRVSQEKLAASEKRAQTQTTEAVQKINAKPKLLGSKLEQPKINLPVAKHTFTRPRNIGSP